MHARLLFLFAFFALVSSFVGCGGSVDLADFCSEEPNCLREVAAWERLVPRAGCDAELDRFKDCIDGSSDPDSECDDQAIQLEDCVIEYCVLNQSDEDCLIIAADRGLVS